MSDGVDWVTELVDHSEYQEFFRYILTWPNPSWPEPSYPLSLSIDRRAAASHDLSWTEDLHDYVGEEADDTNEND